MRHQGTPLTGVAVEAFVEAVASILKKPGSRSPFWFAAFRGADGKRKQKSTGTTDRRLALQMAVEWEKTALTAKRGAMTEAQIRKVMGELLEQATGEPLHFASVRDFFEHWIRIKEGAKSEKTALKYKQVRDSFLAFLGRKAGMALGTIGPSDVERWREGLHQQGRSASTVNGLIKVLSAAFERARREGYIPANPCIGVESLRDAQKGERDVFTLEQVRSLVRAAQGTDWAGAVLLAVLTGLRLKDIANLEWNAIDLDSGFLRVKTAKTGKGVAVPIHPELRLWLESVPRGIGKAPVFASLTGMYTGGKSGLSGQFKRLMEKAGIRGEILRRGQSAGRSAGRTTTTLSFHSLRHTFVSALANAGVPEELRQELAGHSSREAHKTYTHHEADRLKAAVASIGRIL
jgi:integrase